MKLALTLLLLAFAPAARAQQSFLVWCTSSGGAASMGSAGTSAFGVIGQTAIGETRGGAFWVRGGFVTDTVVMNAIVGVGDEKGLPAAYALDQNYPNPFNPSTTIRYALRKAQHVQLKIYSLLGNEVTTLVDAAEEPGVHLVTWHAESVASGVYFCRLRTEEFTASRKLLLLR